MINKQKNPNVQLNLVKSLLHIQIFLFWTFVIGCLFYNSSPLLAITFLYQ